MLNFSKINVLIIYFLFIVISIFTFLNFQNENNQLINKKINLGLDLQGGSYLLLEINSDSLVKEKIQSKVIPIKKLFKENEINYTNFKINEKKLTLSLDNLEKFDLLFYSRQDNFINPYIDNYRSHELEYKKIKDNQIEIFFSKFGLLTINNSALKQSIEIIRRRIDDVGTKEPTILQRGEKRIMGIASLFLDQQGVVSSFENKRQNVHPLILWKIVKSLKMFHWPEKKTNS